MSDKHVFVEFKTMLIQEMVTTIKNMVLFFDDLQIIDPNFFVLRNTHMNALCILC